MLVYRITIALLLFTIVLPGCWVDNLDCENGRGEVVSEILEVPYFSGIHLRIDADVYISQGDDSEVIFDGQLNILDELEIYVHNDVLIIDTDHCIRDHRPIEIIITNPDWFEIGISGSGDVVSENQLTTTFLDVNISGSGDMDLDVDAAELDIDVSGSGDIYLTGESRELDYRASGSGDLRSFGHLTERADINISGSGDVEVSVEEFLDIRISGSGNVYFKGNPSISSSVSGSGDVINAN